MMGFRLWLLLPLLLLLVGCGTGRFSGQGWSGLVLEGDTLYVGSGEGRILTFGVQDLNTNIGWRFPPQGVDPLGAVYSAPAVTENKVYLATSFSQKIGGIFGSQKQTGRIYAVDKDGRDGELLFPISGLAQEVGPLVGNPVVAGDTLLVGSSDGNLYALDAEDGELQWIYTTEGKVWSAPAVKDGVVYFGSHDHNLYAIGLADGPQDERWRFRTGGAITGTPLIMGDTAYIGAFDGMLYAVDTNTGETMTAASAESAWPVTLDGWAWAGPVTDGEVLYVGTLGGTLYALDPVTGKDLWLAPSHLGEPILVPPVILPERLVVATEDKKLHILDRRNGREKLPCSLDARVRAPMVARGDFVYLVDTDEWLREINLRTCDKRSRNLKIKD